MKNRILTGITTSGIPHLGNYFGAIRPSLELAKESKDSFFFLADYHSIIKVNNPQEVTSSIENIALAWLSSGLDTKSSYFYKQSDIREILELSWILHCVTAKGLMNRAHAYKALKENNDDDKGINMGLFSYPILMAADILMFNSTHVPVGPDQLQHLEMTRDIANRFNHIFGDTFVVPEAIINDDESIPGIDGKKMSKSRGTFITARAYLKKNIEAEFLRYYYASKLNGSMEDLDMNMSEFVQKVNGDLVGKFINIQSRCSGFLLKHFDGEILSQKEIVDINPIDAKLEGEIEQASERIKEAYNLRNTSRAVKEIMQLVDQINNYIQEKKPWETAKHIEDISKVEILSLHGVLSLALRSFGKISILLKPVLPITCNKIERDFFCRNTPFLWNDIFDLRIKKIRNIGHLIKRVNEEDVLNLVEVGE